VRSRAAGAQSANLTLSDWSPNGLLYSAYRSSGDYDLWLLPLVGDPKPASFWPKQGDQLNGNFSPDGKLVAYSSNETGKFEVHVTTFPSHDDDKIVSSSGGGEPRWRDDGSELY
jgi:Tol biopolymer transport system component